MENIKQVANPNPKANKQASDYECPICMEICAEPIVTPCGHFFCLQCQTTVTSLGMACPLCRVHFRRSFVPVVDKKLQQEIRSNAAEAFEKRKQELIQMNLWRGSKTPVRFVFGNTHDLISDPREPRRQVKNVHRWSMFLTLLDPSSSDPTHASTAKYIKSVTYHLHPTFRPRAVRVDRPPFLLSRLGWGYFEVFLDVEFQPWVQLGTERITHTLDFHGRGKTNICAFDIDLESFDKTERTDSQSSEASPEQFGV